jgi:hypothetical protein
VKSVAISTDGKNWQEARLDPPEGRFAWTPFRAAVIPQAAGLLTLFARARDSAGRTQPLNGTAWNPSGYCNNDIHSVSGTVT